jgi:hypothetical protein
MPDTPPPTTTIGWLWSETFFFSFCICGGAPGCLCWSFVGTAASTMFRAKHWGCTAERATLPPGVALMRYSGAHAALDVSCHIASVAFRRHRRALREASGAKIERMSLFFFFFFFFEE